MAKTPSATTAETVAGSVYDFPKYYDLVFGSDWKAEHDFLVAAFERYAKCPVQRLFEPACGTGRLIFRLAKTGYEVAGNDLNPKAVAFCNKRLKRHGFPETAFVGDMADFKVSKKYDAAFNTINSFRHLPSEELALAHLKCMANALRIGGLYLLGLHLTPTKGKAVEEESWSARRGNLVVNTYMWTIKRDKRARNEHIGLHFDIYTPTQQMRIDDRMDYRTYTAEQMNELLSGVPEFEVVETHDFAYLIDDPITIDERTEDVIFVLRKRATTT